MVDTLTLDNISSSAWEVTSTSGTDVSASTGVNNPDISLSNVGTRYEITNNGYSNHPLEFLDANDNVLLSQSGSGSYESDGSVNWVDNGSTVEFTLTQPLSNVLETYRCTIHTGTMAGTIISPTTVDYTPSSGSVSFTSPADNSTEENPVTFDMQATGFTIEAASNGVQDGAGHFHILVNQSPLNPGEVIPNDPANGYYHYGGGETTADITLPTSGSNTVVLQAGDANHRAYDLTDSITVTATTASSPSIDYTPATGSVSFTTPSDAATVENPVTFNMQATDFTIEPASNGAQDGAGHFHILVNQSALSAGQSIPNDPENGYYHYGEGETTASITLPTGSNTVVLQAGDANHNAYDLTDSITITVESPTTPIANLTQNVNTASQRTVLQAIADDTTARRQAADKQSAIDNIVDNADQQAVQNFFGGIAGDATAEDLLTGDNALIDKVSEDVDAIETLNTEERAIRKLLCRREGFDPANFADLDAVAADQGLMQAIAARQESSKILARSQKASAAAAASLTAMQEVIASQTARVEVIASQTAMQEVAASQTAMQEVAASQTTMQEVAASQTARDEVIASQTAMQEVAASQTAMQEVIASQTTMQEVRDSPTADSIFHLSNLYAGTLDAFASINTGVAGGMDDIAASQTAMQSVIASQTARDEVIASQTAIQEVAASQTAMNEVAASQTAMQEVAASQMAMQEVANSQTAMQEVATDVTAFNQVASSSTARNEIENSSVAINTLNSYTSSFSEYDFDTNSYFKQLSALTDANGVWVETANTDGQYVGRHRLNVRGGTVGTTTNKFVFNVTHSGNAPGGVEGNVTTSGQKYRP